MKKFLAIILTLALALSLMSVATVTASAETEGDYEYELINGGTAVEITKYNGTGGDVTIPATIAGKPVTGIGAEAFWDCTALTDIVIPNSVVSIGSGAFVGCTSLIDFSFPIGVTVIESGMFENCSSLTSITISNRVTRVEGGAFSYCSKLSTVYYGGSKADRANIEVVNSPNDWNDPFLNATWIYQPVVSNGDATGDNSVDMKDVLQVRKFIAGLPGVTVDKSAADVDGDGELTMKDVLLIRKHIAGLI